MERYVSLIQKLAKANDWALWSALDDVEIPERLKRLEKMFLEHAWHYDDLGSAKLAEYIMTTVTDEQMLPFALGVIRPEGEFLELDQTKWKEIGEASRAATINRARKAMELFAKLPVFEPVARTRYLDDDRNVDQKYIAEDKTLSKTKEALLNEVANGWREARGEEAADCYFDFIREAKLHRDDEDIRARVIRKITDAGFPVLRLVHTMARFHNELSGNKGPVEILAHGWVKHSQDGNLGDLIGAFFALEPLLKPVEIPSRFGSASSSAESFDFVRRVAEQIKPVDDKVRRMLAKVNNSGYGVQYPKQDLAVPTVILTHCGEIRDENFGHKTFEYERDGFKKWLEENREDPRLRVHFHYVGHNWKKEVLVNREDILY